ncbi:hypothetical protein NDU88_000858 [Pleurodeles waltl]|uniref:Uncharacterized protein n=1 Tax=Pleurodeles waltl TaxID=8319 RepID=A0AAV7P9H4_PLEWA|nr:hypothetical protein NDU88_000858 [Pleurodeles waltl]
MGVISPIGNGNVGPAEEEEGGGKKRTENKQTGVGETVVCVGGSLDEDETSETRGDGKPEEDRVREDPVD